MWMKGRIGKECRRLIKEVQSGKNPYSDGFVLLMFLGNVLVESFQDYEQLSVARERRFASCLNDYNKLGCHSKAHSDQCRELESCITNDNVSIQEMSTIFYAGILEDYLGPLLAEAVLILAQLSEGMNKFADNGLELSTKQL